MEQGKEVHPFTMPASWEIALNDTVRPDKTGCYIVKGPKNSGKSTFARTLVNRLLESCVEFPVLFLFGLTWFKLSTCSVS